MALGGKPGGFPLEVANISLLRESNHNPAYLFIDVTSGTGAGLCGVSGEGDSRGIGTWLCRILHVNFREFLFHALE
jgi:hypothetical protein